ncbi:hypothetical protein Tco_0424588 [Tanacetum coccineum]
MQPICDMGGQSYTNEGRRKAEWRKNKSRLKIDLGRFPIYAEAMNLTDYTILQSHTTRPYQPADPVNSLSMGDEHLDTIPATESDEVIKSSVENLVPIPKSDFYHEEFADELAHIISPSEYEYFCFKIEPELGNLTMYVVEDIFPTREPRVHVPNVLPTHPNLDTDFILLSEPLFAYVVWIFLSFLTYLVAPPYLLSCGNEDTIFDHPESPFIILLCRMYLIGVELS